MTGNVESVGFIRDEYIPLIPDENGNPQVNKILKILIIDQDEEIDTELRHDLSDGRWYWPKSDTDDFEECSYEDVSLCREIAATFGYRVQYVTTR